MGWLREARRYPSAAVATPHYLATHAGVEVLDSGGNAVDAAIAANLVLGVVTPYLCGYGGDLLALVHNGDATAYRGVGRSPGHATVEFVREHAETDEMPTFGPHTVTVPGAIDGWFALLERYGTRSFGDLAARALRYANEGFPLTRRGAWFLNRSADMYRHFGLDDVASAFGGVAAGEWLRQPELAATIQALADGGPDVYYRGPIGAAIAQRLQQLGACMTATDIASHEGAWVSPLRARFRDVEVLELPPPTQGVTALEVLRIVDGLDLPPDGPDRHHMLLEAMKLALSDRDEHVGDPDSMVVPAEALLADEWAGARRRAIDPRLAGFPRRAPGPDGGTTYLCAADEDGLLVSLIQSNFTAAGSGVRVGEWGINLQNRGSSFRLDAAHVNGLAPNKLPMHTLIPALALRDERPWLVFGSMGGHGQAQTQLQMLVRMVVDGDDPQWAISAPRWAVNPGSWEVSAEERFDATWLDDLRARGHTVRVTRAFDDGMGHAHAIACAYPGYAAASDPRAEGGAGGC